MHLYNYFTIKNLSLSQFISNSKKLYTLVAMPQKLRGSRWI